MTLWYARMHIPVIQSACYEKNSTICYNTTMTPRYTKSYHIETTNLISKQMQSTLNPLPFMHVLMSTVKGMALTAILMHDLE